MLLLFYSPVLWLFNFVIERLVPRDGLGLGLLLFVETSGVLIAASSGWFLTESSLGPGLLTAQASAS